MKNSQLKGMLKDMENKNKNFSYSKTIKILDVAHYIYIDSIKKYDYTIISDYKKSKYIFNEIVEQFEEVYNFLNEGKVIMATCLLRNIYEEIMYIMATTIDGNQDINPFTTAGYFKKQVETRKEEVLSDLFEKEDISEIYSYLSKLTHVTNLKEITSYFLSTKKYNRYITVEIKFITVLIEFMYLDFLNKICEKENYEMFKNIMLFSTYVEIINFLYFIANSENKTSYLSKYFYGEKNQEYLKKKKDDLSDILKDFKVNKKSASITIKKLSKELNKQIKESNYSEKADEIIGLKGK